MFTKQKVIWLLHLGCSYGTELGMRRTKWVWVRMKAHPLFSLLSSSFLLPISAVNWQPNDRRKMVETIRASWNRVHHPLKIKHELQIFWAQFWGMTICLFFFFLLWRGLGNKHFQQRQSLIPNDKKINVSSEHFFVYMLSKQYMKKN